MNDEVLFPLILFPTTRASVNLQSFVGVKMLLQSVVIKVAFVANGTVIRESAHVSSNVLLVPSFGSETFLTDIADGHDGEVSLGRVMNENAIDRIIRDWNQFHPRRDSLSLRSNLESFVSFVIEVVVEVVFVDDEAPFVSLGVSFRRRRDLR